MFQSYSFKQFLTISLATNYKAVMENKQTHYHHEISSISVQVLTSAEMTMLILRDQALFTNMLTVLDSEVEQLTKDPKNRDLYMIILTILHDFKYLARPETV